MSFVAGAVMWAGYTLAWWGWLAVTDRVPAGDPQTLWWPSIRDLVAPGRQDQAVPPRLAPVGGSGPSSSGTNAAAANILSTSTAPPPTVGSGSGDTGSVTSASSGTLPGPA